MAELLLELYSEEIPPQLQIAARSQIKQFIENTFKEKNIKYKELFVYSSPTRLTLLIKELAEKIKIEANMSTKRENFCFAPLCNKAERIAIPKSSLLVAIAYLTIN